MGSRFEVEKFMELKTLGYGRQSASSYRFFLYSLSLVRVTCVGCPSDDEKFAGDLMQLLANSMAMMKRCLCRSGEDFKGLLRTTNIHLYSYKEIRRATNNFDHGNKLGRGGFGTVYKGTFGDGTAFPAKVLSCESEQGIKEFLTEIESIGEAKHANLFSLLGCCVQKQNRILVYEFAENNSLDHALKGGKVHISALGSASGAAILPWSVRSDICMGTASGLSYLHKKHEPNIVHRYIKASNVLLGRNYSPKIRDFGLAKLFPDNVTHVSTRVVGTTGYLAPEYVVHGQLTKKADVYSFGVLLLEAWLLYEQGTPLDIVDASVKDYPEAEVLRYVKVGLAYKQAAPNGRPTMRQVVKMLSRPAASRELEIRLADHHYSSALTCPGLSLSPLSSMATSTRRSSVRHRPGRTPPPLHRSSMVPKKTPKGKSGFFGVRQKPLGNWGVEFYDARRRWWIGTYPSTHEAARAYDVAVWLAERPRSHLNFPEIESRAKAEMLVPQGFNMKKITTKKETKKPSVVVSAGETDEEAMARFAQEHPEYVQAELEYY
ncbi:probable LRR receptor-like serine/threonine-protein kinase At1g53430 [Triticum aestivum]|uniref:probable LRR receptor-like serine/threonine-protein kinase At1g53430 n=1 Tax=Triticum aestivum TaxID=4565 RepID=UPI001D02C96F|nr:probable LRR receptor-like serine/threonine-protein kinase At1g53430 [Triticum aestivum]